MVEPRLGPKEVQTEIQRACRKGFFLFHQRITWRCSFDMAKGSGNQTGATESCALLIYFKWGSVEICL